MFMESNLPVTMPALALRGLTVFPNMLTNGTRPDPCPGGIDFR